MSETRNQRRQNKRLKLRVIDAAVKYDHEGCDVCGHQPFGREMYPIGFRGKRVVGVCGRHMRRLDTVLSLQFFMEGEENIKQREVAAGVLIDGQAH